MELRRAWIEAQRFGQALSRALDMLGARLPRERHPGQIAMDVGQGPRLEPLEAGGSGGKRRSTT